MELHKIAIRVLFAYVVLLALMRFSGKRVIQHEQARPAERRDRDRVHGRGSR